MTAAANIVRALLDSDEPVASDEPIASDDITPEDVVRALGIGFTDNEFTFEWHMGRYGRQGTCYVSWKKRLRKGKPIYLGTIQVVSDEPHHYGRKDANLGKWYITSVPYHSKTRIPRGLKVIRGREGKYSKITWGYGAVRYRSEPKLYTKYFNTRAEAAGYLASMIEPHRHIKVVESLLK